MTNYEFIKTLDLSELADYYCYIHDDSKSCVTCVYNDICHEYNTKSGIRNWLEMEHKTEGGW